MDNVIHDRPTEYATPPHRRPAARDRSGALWWLSAILLGGWVVWHFAAVLLSVVPANRLSTGARPVTDAYLGPLFVQGWRLFAPYPVTSDIRVYARGLYRSGGDDESTPWLALTDPQREAALANRLSSRSLTATMEWSAALALLNMLHAEGSTDSLRAHVLDEWADASRKPAALVVIEAAGCAAVASSYPILSFHAVQVAVTVTGGPPNGEQDPSSDASMAAGVVLFHPAAFEATARLR